MKHLALSVKVLSEKAKDARIDVLEISELQNLPRPSGDASFMIEKKLYVWMEKDVTLHDGESSIAPKVSEKAPGRYRLATLGMPLVKS